MPSPKATTLTTATIEQYRQSCIARGLSLNTAKAYSTDLRMFFASQDVSSLPMISYETTAMLFLNQLRQTASPKTTGRYLTSLRTFGAWATGDRDLLLDYKPPTPGRGIPHPLPGRLADLDAMVAVARNPQQAAMVAFCGYAGMRLGEALAMSRARMDFDAMLFVVRGKGDKERYVPISERVMGVIAPQMIGLAPSQPLIAYGDRPARKAITAMGVRAGVARAVSSHDLRATFATHLSETGTPSRVIQELLGHASGTTTEVYIGTSAASMRAAVSF